MFGLCKEYSSIFIVISFCGCIFFNDFVMYFEGIYNYVIYICMFFIYRESEVKVFVWF